MYNCIYMHIYLYIYICVFVTTDYGLRYGLRIAPDWPSMAQRSGLRDYGLYYVTIPPQAAPPLCLCANKRGGCHGLAGDKHDVFASN